MPEDGVHAAHQPRVEHPGVEQGLPLFGLLHRMEDAGVDEHALPGLQGQPRLVDIHRQRALHGKDVLKLFVPVPAHRFGRHVLGVAGDGKQSAAVLRQLFAVAGGYDLVAKLYCHTAQFLSPSYW